ncbi:hypothetical protein FMEAI12_2840060 [Parafrankia sp. Ea1.12]|nr:hypothetical protein FMEAI12_2840060 [Parafrankia sp. Ea1.12]
MAGSARTGSRWGRWMAGTVRLCVAGGVPAMVARVAVANRMPPNATGKV